jgi:uncharacterized caspase-like protein
MPLGASSADGATMLSQSELIRSLSRSRHALIFLDTGRANVLTPSLPSGLQADDGIGIPKGLAIFSATRDGQAIPDGPADRHSVFTQALLEALSGRADKDGDGNVSTSELDAYLSDTVDALSGHTQTTSSITAASTVIQFPVLPASKTPQ